jgi:hypothetical protein
MSLKNLHRLCLLLFAVSFLPAQPPTATVTGLIADSGGGAMAGATVTIKSVETGVQRTTSTNQSGAYQLLGLQAGMYDFLASRPGFSTVKRSSINLRLGDEVRIDLTLAPGEARETVIVVENAPLIETDSSVATVVNKESIQDLPSDGRQLQNLALIVPGIDAGWNLSTAANRYGKARENTEGAFSVSGARSRSNDFVFDGMPMNLRQYSVINFEPSNEAVQELSVTSAVPRAEFGRTMGGQIQIITRAGATDFHGAAYEFFRNNALNSNDTLSNRAGLPRGIVRHNQFGGSLGGPIWKQKHFFFVNTELLRNLEGSETHTSNVPTADERAGLIPYIDAFGNARTLDLSARIAPVSAKLVQLYPQPNSASIFGNYIASLAIGLNDYQYHVRTDHHLTERDIVTLRTSWNLNDQTYIIDRFGGPYIPGFPLPNPERTTNGTIGYMHTFGPQLVNEARLGVNRYGNILANGDSRNAAAFGLPNGSDGNGIPTISFAQGGLAGLGGLSWYNREQDELTVHASDAISLLRRSHSLKFGVEGSRYHFNTRGADDERGTLYFDGSRNGLIPQTPANAEANVLTDLLLGQPVEATITVGEFGRGYRQWAWGLFAQDSWRATRRLTLDYGLRYEYNPPWTEVNNKLANFVPGVGIVTPRSPGWNGLYRPDRNNVAPRFGFAYDLTGQGRTMIRGGFGIMYETLLQASTVQQIENNPPFAAAAVTTSPTPFSHSSSPSTALLDLRSSAQPSTSLSAIPLDLRNPYTTQFSIDVQQQFWSNWLFEAGYRGSRGVHLPFDYDINQVPLDTLTSAQRSQIGAVIASGGDTTAVLNPLRPNPGFSSISLFADAATSTYHSLQTKLERRFHSGLNLLAAYTWSKSIDDATDFASGDASEHVLDSMNRNREKAVSSFDVPHRFSAAFNYPLPARKRNIALSGWQVNGIVIIQAGQPFTPYTSQFDPYRNETYNRLNVIGDPLRNVPAGDAYNPAAFALPALGTYGNSGRNIVRGDRFRSADLSLFRTFSVREAMKLQLRFEAMNSLNNVNYQGPVTDQSTTPGLFVATGSPRLVQLGAKLSF